MPSLQSDGVAFFPNVLKAVEFQQNGILFGDEAAPETSASEMKRRVQWAVIDPRKHILYIWEKKDEEFPDSAVALGASVFTNGPFNLYRGQKNGFWAHASYWRDYIALLWGLGVLAILAQILPFLRNEFDKLRQEALRKLLIQHFGDSTPEGYVFGKRDNIHRDQLSRPHHYHFGRKPGREFADYIIDVGDSPQADEFIGGLFRTVNNYTDALDDPRADSNGVRITHQRHDFGYWGLAPLSISDPDLKAGGVEGAYEALSAYDHQYFPELPGCVGVLIVVFYGGDTSVMAGKLIGVRVKEAVRIDDSDSVLFGHGAEILVGKGDDMSVYKRLYNKWGYMTVRG